MSADGPWMVAAIREDDYGCEERPDGWEPQVVVTLTAPSGERRWLRVADRWLLEHDIREGDPWPDETDV